MLRVCGRAVCIHIFMPQLYGSFLGDWFGWLLTLASFACLPSLFIQFSVYSSNTLWLNQFLCFLKIDVNPHIDLFCISLKRQEKFIRLTGQEYRLMPGIFGDIGVSEIAGGFKQLILSLKYARENGMMIRVMGRGRLIFVDDLQKLCDTIVYM